ncbi:MAG: M6 family metalloprotease domain-containing protein [Akkermansiaceae bacterium]
MKKTCCFLAKRFTTFATLITLILCHQFAFATSAAPFAFEEEQPDGSKIHLHIEGDEFFHRLHDTNGYTVLKDRGWFVFAERGKKGKLVPTGLRVGQDDPKRAGLSKNILPDPAIRNARRKAMGEPQQAGGTAGDGPATATAVSGTMKNLVVLLRFSNHSTRAVPSVSDIDILMNAPGGDPTLAPTGSVRDCFLENSYGQLSLDSTVLYWVDLPNTEAYYANGNRGLTTKTHEALKYALDTLDADPNFQFGDFDEDGDGNIDAITFLHSGYGAEFGGTSADGANYLDRIWSHKWGISGGWTSSDGVHVGNYHISPGIWGTSGTTIGRIGVICHETGHFLGLPDLYDGNDSDGDGSSGSGIGSYCLMANSWGFDGSQKYPPHMSVWCKTALGWMNPTVINSAGNYSLTQAQTTSSAYRINLGYASGEYLLVENRQPVGFDSRMPQGGLAIFHIDEAASTTVEGFPGQTGWPANGNHYKVALLQADGRYDLERGSGRGDSTDVYHAGYVNQIGPDTVPNTDSYQGGNIVVTNNRIFNISAAGSTMTFSFEVVGASEPTPPEAPSNLAAGSASENRIDLSWNDNSDDETSFSVERSSGGSPFAEIASLSSDSTSFSDTGLSSETAYTYRIRAGNNAGFSTYSNQATATTDSPPLPPVAPTNLAATAVSDTGIDITWTDASDNEDGFLVDRSLDTLTWSEAVADLPAGTTSFADGGLNSSTTYFYRVRSYNAQGTATSANASATTDAPPAYVDAVSSSSQLVSGTVTGNHTATHQAGDGSVQSIREKSSGGKPSRRRSFLDHRWSFPSIRGGVSVSLFATAWAEANNENDDFEIQYSTNGGSSWISFNPPLIIANGTSAGNTQVSVFPEGTQGEIDLRVIDTDSTQGATTLDTVVIDQLFIRTDIDPNDFPPAAPADVVATVKSSTEIDITWSDLSSNERGFAIYRSADGGPWSEVGNTMANTTSFTDTSAAPGTTYQFMVASFSASFETESNPSNSVTTPDGLSLESLAGGKSKGKIYVDLTWSGGNSLNSVDIFRSVNGGAFEKILSGTNNDGSQRDQTSLKGGQSFAYRIQSTDGSIISNVRNISF